MESEIQHHDLLADRAASPNAAPALDMGASHRIRALLMVRLREMRRSRDAGRPSTGTSRHSVWRQWRERPEQLWFRKALFQVHLWVGGVAGAYIFLMSLSGSMIVYRNELIAHGYSVEPIVTFHTNLATGPTGRFINGVGAVCLTLLCLTGAVIWWPGVQYWRRSLTIALGTRFPRLNWDLHSALGFWCFLFVLIWGMSGAYFVFPEQFEAIVFLGRADTLTDTVSFWLAQLHFGRFTLVSKAIWVVLGLVPAVLAFTGVFICCRRMMLRKPSNPKSAN
jgi:uncharacterized iron-regulated membrane protein